MKCCVCKEEITENDVYYEAVIYHGKSTPSHQVRSGWWNFHMDCWVKVMVKSEVSPENPFLTKDTPVFNEKDLVVEMSHNIMLDIDTHIVKELLQKTNKDCV